MIEVEGDVLYDRLSQLRWCMETEHYTHPRVFNLSARPSTYWNNPHLPLKTVHITHQVPYHHTKPTPVLHTNPIQTVMYLTLYRFWTSQHPTFALPSKPRFMHDDIPFEPHEIVVTCYSLSKHFSRHLNTGKNCKGGTLDTRSAYAPTYYMSIRT